MNQQPDDEAGDSIADEQAADLAALQAGANGAQAAQAGPAVVEEGGDEIKPPSAQAMALAGMAVGMLRPLIVYAVPSLREAPDELWAPVPEGVAAVMDEYGAAAEWMRSPWARLAFACAPLAAFGAMQAMKEKPKPQAQALPPPPAPGAPAEPGSKTVTFGTVMPAEATP